MIISVVDSILDDMMQKAGPGAVLHPELNVPVSKDFLNKDIERINKRKMRYSRPANKTEVQ